MQQSRSEQAEQQSTRRLWWILGSVLAVSLALVTWVYTLYDAAPPNPAHYEPPAWPLTALSKDDLPELDQAWAEVVAAWQVKIPRPKLSFPDQPTSRADIDIANKAADQQFLESNSLLISKFWMFARAAVKHQTLPWQAGKIHPSADVLADLWLMVELELKQEPFAQNAETRLEKALVLMLFSQLFLRLGPGSIDDALLLESWGMEGILNSLAHVSLSSAQLREILEVVNQDETATALLAWNVSTKLRDSLRDCRDKEPAELHYNGPSPLLPRTTDPSWENELDKVLFKRNLTLLELIEARDSLSRAFGQNAHTGSILYETLIRRYANPSWPASWWKAAHPNRAGREIVQGQLARLNWDMEVQLERVSSRRCLSTILALRLFELDNGSLPKVLVDLAPQYLLTLPADPITGESFRWSRANGKIYSIGGNGRDDGGNFEKGAKSPAPADWGVIYPWLSSGH